MNADVKKHVEIYLNPQETAVKRFWCRHLELLLNETTSYNLKDIIYGKSTRLHDALLSQIP